MTRRHPTDLYRRTFGPLIRANGVRKTAREAGMSKTTLSDWLLGKPGVSLSEAKLESLAIALGVEIRLIILDEEKRR